MAEPQIQHHSQTDDRLTSAAATLGYEIVDIAGFLDLVETHAEAQSGGLKLLKDRARMVSTANDEVLSAVKTLVELTATTVEDVGLSAASVRNTGEKTHAVASWVQDVSERTASVANTIADVRNNNQQIASIATQVNTLAINAKIEAARAGEAGRGFAVVAEAINELSRRTSAAAVEISNNIEALTNWITALGNEAGKISSQAADVLDETGNIDATLTRAETSIKRADDQSRTISEQADQVATALQDFAPALTTIDGAIEGTTKGIKETHGRVLKLIDTSEIIVQSTALMVPDSEDARFVQKVQSLSGKITERLEQAITEGRTTLSRLFDRNYRPIPGSNPEQYLTEATRLLDELLPPIQEPALGFDPKIVFCAAVDVNGYLPTHNLKFSHPPGDDPVWNTANCRNRRIFNDRVGLKAGRSRAPFLLQVYRRDMGGGTFKMMKDLSAPIIVQGQHWGGLRLAYGFD